MVLELAEQFAEDYMQIYWKMTYMISKVEKKVLDFWWVECVFTL